MQRNHDDGSEVIIVIATHPRLPPITFSYSLKAAGAAFADAYATRRSLPQNSATLQGGNHANRPADVGGAVDSVESAVLGSLPCGKAGR